MIFWLLFIGGSVGMGLLALLSSVRFGHHTSGPGHAVGHGTSGHAALGHSHAAPGHHHLALKWSGRIHRHSAPLPPGNDKALNQAGNLGPVGAHHHFHLNPLALIPSPLDFFAICMGIGAGGLLLQAFINPGILWLVALFCGILFDFVIIRPAMAAMLQFASSPSAGLEGMVANSAEAITKFDDRGQGLVRLCMDGQLVQLLATLDNSEIASGVAVHKGDQLVVLEVDAKKNVCRVTTQL